MAWYTKPIGVNRKTGSTGGMTFQKNFTKFIIRKRAVPVDKNTPLQTTVRNKLGSLSSQWRTLSAPDQTTWDDEAPTYPRTNSIGNSYELSDINLFRSSGRFKQSAGQATLAACAVSTPAAAPVLSFYVFDPPGTDFRVVLSPSTIPANRTLLYFISDFSDTAHPFNFKNRFQLFASNVAAFNTTANIWSQFVSVIQMEPASGITHYRQLTLLYMDDTTGQVSAPLTITITYTF